MKLLRLVGEGKGGGTEGRDGVIGEGRWEKKRKGSRG